MRSLTRESHVRYGDTHMAFLTPLGKLVFGMALIALAGCLCGIVWLVVR